MKLEKAARTFYEESLRAVLEFAQDKLEADDV